MTRTHLVQTPTSGIPGSTGATRGGGAFDPNEVDNVVGLSPNAAREEVNDAFEDMSRFHQMDPDEIMRRAAGHSARLSYIRVCAMRIEDFKRQWKDVRTRELEPCIEELRKQWENGSRLHTIREFDWKVEAGER